MPVEDLLRIAWYLLLSFQAYGLFLTARMGIRRHAARLVQLAVVSTAVVAGYLRYPFEPWCLGAAAALTAILTILPAVLARQAAIRREAGDPAAAARLLRWRAGLVWGWAARVDAELARAAALEEAGHIEEAERSFATLAAIEARRTGDRSGVDRARVEAALDARDWSGAIRRFEELAAARAIPLVLLLRMARAYAETGEANKALQCLERVERDEQKTLLRHERQIAQLQVLALLGETERVDRLLMEPDSAWRDLPHYVPAFWAARARERAGSPRDALERYRAIERQIPPAARPWRRAVSERIRACESHPATRPDTVPVDYLEALEAVTRVEPDHVDFTRRRPTPVTTGFLAANVAMWILTIWLMNRIADTLGAPPEDPARIAAWLTSRKTAGDLAADIPPLPEDPARIGAWWAGAVEQTAYDRLGMNDSAAFRTKRTWWRLGASMFLHAGALHLLFNAYGIWVLGTFIERIFGSRRTFLIYVTAGFAGSLASATIPPDHFSLGASGALLGLLGSAVGVLARYRKRFPNAFRRHYLGICLFLSVLALGTGLMVERTDNYAHVGGFLAGVVFGVLLRPPSDRHSSRIREVLVLAGVIACTLALGFTYLSMVRNLAAPRSDTASVAEGRRLGYRTGSCPGTAPRNPSPHAVADPETRPRASTGRTLPRRDRPHGTAGDRPPRPRKSVPLHAAGPRRSRSPTADGAACGGGPGSRRGRARPPHAGSGDVRRRLPTLPA